MTGPAGVPTRVLLGSFSVGGPDPLHALIRAARAGDAQALADVLGRVRRAAPGAWPSLGEAIAVPVPGHARDSIPPLVRAAADTAATVRGWLYDDQALVRHVTATEAKLALERDLSAEVDSLEWVGPPGNQAIVLVDDVVRTGGTLDACAEAIRATGDRRSIVAIVLAAADTSG